MKHFKEEFVEEIEFSEIDLQYPFYEDEVRNEVDGPDENIWSDTVSMDIDDAIEALKELKEKGSNRVYLYAHTDHVGYIFTGVKCEQIK